MKWKLTHDIEDSSQAFVDTVENVKMISWKILFTFSTWLDINSPFDGFKICFTLKVNAFNFIQSLMIQNSSMKIIWQTRCIHKLSSL